MCPISAFSSGSGLRIGKMHALRKLTPQRVFDGHVTHLYNPSTWEAEAGGHQVQGQPRKVCMIALRIVIWLKNCIQNIFSQTLPQLLYQDLQEVRPRISWKRNASLVPILAFCSHPLFNATMKTLVALLILFPKAGKFAPACPCVCHEASSRLLSFSCPDYSPTLTRSLRLNLKTHTAFLGVRWKPGGGLVPSEHTLRT